MVKPVSKTTIPAYRYRYESEEWDSEDDTQITMKPCPAVNPTIKIPRDIYLIMKHIVLKASPNEVLMYMDAEKQGDDTYRVTRVWVPRQVVSETSVEVKDEDASAAPGVAHSHPFTTSHASFSGTDDEYINRNHDFSILFNGDGEITEAYMRLTLPCGRKVVMPAEVEIQDEFEEVAKEEAARLLKGKIRRKRYVSPYLSYYGYGYYDYEPDYYWARREKEEKEEISEEEREQIIKAFLDEPEE